MCNDKYVLLTVKFCTEIDLEIIRIVQYIKKTASFFKFRNTETRKTIIQEITILSRICNEKQILFISTHDYVNAVYNKMLEIAL
jgi:hypothetical protein